MRTTTTPFPPNGANPMIINGLNIETNSMTATNAANNHNECQAMCLPVATKSEPKPKKPIDSQSRATKRPPSERRFKCDQCERMFFTRKDVKRHLVVHTGIRNFACPFCTQKFGRKDHLVRHAKKSHNRDTRSSTVKNNSLVSQTIDKSTPSAVPALVEPKANGGGVGGPPLSVNQSKQTFNYQNNCQTNDQSSLVLLNNGSNPNMNAITNSHSDPNGSAHCVSYPHPNQTPCHTNHVMLGGMHPNESLCQYMSGHSMHPLDEMMSSNGLKSETPPMAAHHYLAFPVSSANLNYPLASGPFLANCLVANSAPGLSSCATSASVAAFGMPVSGVVNGQNPFAVDVNPSLPHFNQAFQ